MSVKSFALALANAVVAAFALFPLHAETQDALQKQCREAYVTYYRCVELQAATLAMADAESESGKLAAAALEACAAEGDAAVEAMSDGDVFTMTMTKMKMSTDLGAHAEDVVNTLRRKRAGN